MRNTIPCTAGQIGLLEPAMIESIVEAKAFQRGHEYFKAGRVRLLEANDRDVTATVRGNSGTYEQTVRLRDGNLVTACTCSLIEQPMCRHCVAVLLEFHRWAAQRGHRESAQSTGRHAEHASHSSGGHGRPSQAVPSYGNGHGNGNGNGAGQAAPPAAAPRASAPSGGAVDQDVRLSDVIAFVEWAQPAMRCLAQNQPLPEAPRLGAGVIGEWVQTVTNITRQHQQQDEVTQALHADLAQRDHQLEQLRQQLARAEADLRTSRESTDKLKHEVESYQSAFGKIGDLAKGIGRFSADIKGVTNDLSRGQSHLEQLAQSFQDVSQSLHTLAKSRPA
ncbi:MAG: hypothetical protein U0172_09880 [Nitrospiraceae bacterium]